MKHESWPTFSFTDLLRPPDGWQVENAILTTYSADLVVVVTALLALTGCDLDYRRTGSRVELVKAIEALRGRVRIIAQANRVAVPQKNRPILKLLDNFLAVVETDENESSWHPKIALVRYYRTNDKTDRQWRVWLGSRNLTHAMNWDAGLTLTSRADGCGQSVAGLADLAAALAARAKLAAMSSTDVQNELAALTWECPSDCEVQEISLLGPNLAAGFPTPPADTDRVLVVSPFLDPTADSSIVREIAQWGGTQTQRTLISTASDLQRLWETDSNVFNGFAKVCTLPFPELPVEGTELLAEDTPDAAVETAEGEELPPAGLHAKLFLAANRTHRQLWIGSANATRRGWDGRNFEVVAATLIGRDAADALLEFAASGEEFKPSSSPSVVDEHEKAIEHARKLLSRGWLLRQEVREDESLIVASSPPPMAGLAVRLEVAALGGTWTVWPDGDSRLCLSGLRRTNRSNLLQVRLSSGDRMCEWLQIAPCDPPPDEARDRALIAQYLDPRTFLLWVRSLLADEDTHPNDADWDDDGDGHGGKGGYADNRPETGLLPTVEEILRAWARDEAAFRAADEKVRAYLSDLERRAAENNQPADLELLQTFQKTWNTLATELR
jgi:hypothetical protein